MTRSKMIFDMCISPIPVMQSCICMYVLIDVCVGANCIELVCVQAITANVQLAHVFVNTQK